MSSNNGVSWLEENSGLTNRTTDALAASGAIVLDGSNGDGVFVSTNNASTWNASNSGLTRGIVSALLVHGLDVLAGSDAGIWRRPLLEMTSVRPPTSAIVKAFGLNQNFPNPFNPSTTISYQLPSQCRITLKIYDVLGREVTTLVNGIETPGYKSTVWDAGGVASGVYYYRLQAGDFVQTKKLSVVK
jgi:peptidoglycan hydrolase-like protein with peptidoglycan-binding domain